MEIKSVISRLYANNFNNNLQLETNKNYGIRMSNSLKADVVSFSARPKLPPRERMAAYAVKLLEKLGLKDNQPVRIVAESKHVPFLRIMTEEAYKKGSGKVSIKVIEPELEALKAKHGITEVFDYEKEAEQEFIDEGALFVNFNDNHCPYKASGLNKKEIAKQIRNIVVAVPKKIQHLFELNPKEIFKSAMDIREGQPVYISGVREHLPQIVKLVDWLYGQNKTKWVKIYLTEPKEFNANIAFYKYAKDALIGKFKPSAISTEKEFLEKDVACLYFRGGDPELFSEVDSKRMAANGKPFAEAIKEYHSRQISETPWLVYYAPTVKSVKLAYPEISDPLEALKIALKDAKKINRVGKLKQHIETIEKRAEKMNGLLDKGYRIIHFISVDPTTKLPDGKTDLSVGLSEKSFFNGARTKMEKNHHHPIVNIPTEEIFTSPTNDSAEGVVSATMPLVLNGKVVDGIKMKFDKGQAIEIEADKNLDMLHEHIKAHSNADRLGEVALVAGSPIAKFKRLFYSTLIDENAACHIALGNAYSDVVRGASKIEDFAQQQEYLKRLRINSSTTHNDFMIGGENVYVYAENPLTGKQVQIIKDDKFLL